MSKRHRHRNQTRRTSNGQSVQDFLTFDPTAASMDAVKTYLQEQVAMLRPQVADTEMAHLFRFGVTVNSAASYRAEALRQVDFKLATSDGEIIDPRSPDGKTPQAQAITRAFNNNFASIIERCELSYCFYGASLLRKQFGPDGRLLRFQWINNNFFILDTDQWVGLRGFRIRSIWGSDIEPDVLYIEPQNAVYLHNVDFFEDFGGLGPAQVAFAQAATETEIAATQLQFFRNMAMPSFAMQPASGESYRPGVDQKQELTELMRRMYQGSANAGRSLILPTRWETLRFQQDFDKLGMPQLTQEARDGVIRIMRVPLELLDPRQATRATGVKFYDQKREWLISFLVPQAERYADVFTEQIAKPVNPDWKIVPDFARVRGIDEDVASKTETVRKQVSDGLLDMYSAQRVLGYQPDENLKNLYMIQGVPVPGDQLQDYWRFAPGNPGKVTGEDTASLKKPTPQGVKPVESIPAHDSQALEPKAIPFLPDAAYRELKSWKHIIERKGRTYAFEAKSLPADAVAYGRLLLMTTGGPLMDTWSLIHTYAAKDFDQTERAYRTNLYLLMIDCFDGKMSRGQFGTAGREEISNAFYNAFRNGLEEAGVDASEISDQEKETLRLEIKMERSYWTDLANDMFSSVIPLKGQPGFEAARDRMLGRIELWINKGLKKIHNISTLYATMNGMKRFVLGGTIDHCKTCSAANGQVHRAQTWLKYGVYPRSDKCLCTGIKCECTFEDTTDRASGNLAAVPVAFGAKSDDAEDDVHVHDEDEREAVAI